MCLLHLNNYIQRAQTSCNKSLYHLSHDCHSLEWWEAGKPYFFLTSLSLVCSPFNGTELEKKNHVCKNTNSGLLSNSRHNQGFFMFLSIGLLQSQPQHFLEAMTPHPPNKRASQKEKKVILLLETDATDEHIRIIRNTVRSIMNAVLPYLAY